MEDSNVTNPLEAPVYKLKQTTSTMDDARALAAKGAPHGTVVWAEEQTAGRGRVAGRAWASSPGESLLCTTILALPLGKGFPRALTLRVGLAALRALERVAPELGSDLRLKWPNDILAGPRGRKICGVLCEATGKTVLVGTGFNLLQTAFPPQIVHKATSAFIECGRRIAPEALLESFLENLSAVVEDQKWKEAIEDRLYRRGERVCFESGPADSGELVRGILAGIGEEGELKIDCGAEGERLFVTGELRAYGEEDR